MAITPKNVSDTFVDRLWNMLQAITTEHVEALKADPTHVERRPNEHPNEQERDRRRQTRL